MRSFCGSYDFLCRAAFDQQGMDRQAAMRHDLPHPLQRLPPALLSHGNPRLGRLTELRCRRGQQVDARSSCGSTRCRTVTCDIAGTFCAQSNREAAKACPNSSTAKKDPQTSCTLPGRSPPSSETDQDRAWCRIEQALAQLTIPARITHTTHFPAPRHKHRARTRSSTGLCSVEQQGHGGGASGRDLTVLPPLDGIAECHREAISQREPNRNCAAPPLSTRSR